MATKCKCEAGIGNTGLPKGANCFSIISAIWLQQKYDSDGNRNGIPLADFGTLADLKDWFTTTTDKDSRLFPLIELEEFVGTDGDPSTVTTPSGRIIKLADGVRSVTFYVPNVPALLQGKLASLGCGEWQYFEVDIEGNVAGGSLSEDGLTLQGYEFDEQSWNTKYSGKTFADSSRLTVSFNMIREQKAYDMYWVGADEIASGFIATQQTGLIDTAVKSTATATTTTVHVSVTAIDLKATPVSVTGLASTAFHIFNVTDNASVTVSSVTEVNGVYTLTFTAQTSADVLSVNVGNDIYESEAVSITIP